MEVRYVESYMEMAEVGEILSDYFGINLLDTLPNILEEDNYSFNSNILDDATDEKLFDITAELDGGSSESIVTEANATLSKKEVIEAVAAYYKEKDIQIDTTTINIDNNNGICFYLDAA